jgi:hypothetical protein
MMTDQACVAVVYYSATGTVFNDHGAARVDEVARNAARFEGHAS